MGYEGFDCTAKLAAGKVVIVVCPLKAIECNQVQHAISMGLVAYAVNEDTDKTAAFWNTQSGPESQGLVLILSQSLSQSIIGVLIVTFSLMPTHAA